VSQIMYAASKVLLGYGSDCASPSGRYDIRDASLQGPPFQVIEHLLLYVQYIQNPVGKESDCYRERVNADSKTDFQDSLAGLRLKDLLKMWSRVRTAW